MAQTPSWKKRLNHLDERYIAMYSGIIDFVDSLTPEEFETLKADLTQPSSTNCSWSLYAAAELARWAADTRDHREADANAAV